MGGGLMQLVAYGAQDVYLTGDPQITFFKVVYRRHTNFSMEAIAQTFNGTPDFGRKVSATIARNGDLIHKCYLQVTLPGLTQARSAYVPYVGHRLINNVELEIGGQRIDKHYGEWLYIWSELTETEGHRSAFDTMVGQTGDITETANEDNDKNQVTGLQNVQNTAISSATLYIPLQFWFCRNAGLALPLIALQYHEVKINVEFETLANCCYGADSPTADATSFDAQLYVDYIYLDTEERRRFAQVKHEYLIEQLQFTGSETVAASANKLRLNFNHPVKELVWTINSDGDATSGVNNNGEWNNYTNADNTDGGTTTADGSGILYGNGANNCSNAKLQLNGHDRFSQRDGSYFNLVQPYQHHTSSPSMGINCYSFALKPEEHQPSGTCNFSRIDNATLNVTSASAGTAKVYAINYNVLRIMSGMGGIAYTN